MKTPLAILVSLVGLTVCRSAPQTTAPASATLRDNPRLPSDQISEFYRHDKFAVLRDIRYKGYVMFDAVALPDKSIRLDGVVEAYPDNLRNEEARRLALLARVAARTVGSHLPPRIQVFVIFYPSPGKPDSAIIFAREPAGALLVGSSAATLYLGVVNDVAHRLAPNDVDVYISAATPGS